MTLLRHSNDTEAVPITFKAGEEFDIKVWTHLNNYYDNDEWLIAENCNSYPVKGDSWHPSSSFISSSIANAFTSTQVSWQRKSLTRGRSYEVCYKRV